MNHNKVKLKIIYISVILIHKSHLKIIKIGVKTLSNLNKFNLLINLHHLQKIRDPNFKFSQRISSNKIIQH